MNWYVLFVMTGYEQKILDEISRTWRIDGLNPFIPMYEAIFKNAGRIHKEKRRLFPGYVFLESDIAGTDFYMAARPYIIRSEHSLKLLRYGRGVDDKAFEMKEAEYQVLSKLYNKEHCVEMSKGLIVGDRAVITSGPLMGFESCIKRVHGSKMEAVVEIEMMGAFREVKVGLEILDKIPAADNIPNKCNSFF